MTYWDFVKAEIRVAPAFFGMFLAVGVVMDMFVWQEPVNWVQRVSVSLIVTAAFVLWTARKKMARSE